MLARMINLDHLFCRELKCVGGLRCIAPSGLFRNEETADVGISFSKCLTTVNSPTLSREEFGCSCCEHVCIRADITREANFPGLYILSCRYSDNIPQSILGKKSEPDSKIIRKFSMATYSRVTLKYCS